MLTTQNFQPVENQGSVVSVTDNPDGSLFDSIGSIGDALLGLWDKGKEIYDEISGRNEADSQIENDTAGVPVQQGFWTQYKTPILLTVGGLVVVLILKKSKVI